MPAVPCGVIPASGRLSVRVTAHRVRVLTVTGEGGYETLVVAVYGVTVIVVEPELDEWFVSPTYIAVNMWLPVTVGV